ncbi:mannose-6-phosphate isomerase, class I [Chitinophaga rhizosphaerae]|uniref:mannose-6-phosphate isomerase, class I n=1 Tax=Chitinophaga rhizosphaerae TaxID=1864947 RepID=UPI000F80C748|nr:mannose-6-phosphate isomerase, class I [Chitinophaga rhizosphaerae]
MRDPNLFYLTGKVQHYAWGGFRYIPELLGQPVTGQPSAEYWMGAHQSAPSLLQCDQPQPLNAWIAEDPAGALGPAAAGRFGELPYLFKILDVKDMLSIQVHPTKSEAEKGFARENEAGIALNAPNRNYKDANHKPEIMVALSEFWLLHGFLPEDKLRKVLAEVPVFSALGPVFEKDGYFGLYKTVMEMPQEEVNAMLRPLAEKVLPAYRAGSLKKEDPAFWTGRAIDNDPQGMERLDRGIFSIYFFNIVYAAPGDAVFQDAGIPHAYLEGQNAELMANSDNVLRGGLTPKYIDVPELLKHTRFEAVHPNILKGEAIHGGQERIYNTPAPDFVLSRIALKAGETYTHTSVAPETWIVLEGTGSAEGPGNNSLELSKGKTLFAPFGTAYKVVCGTDLVIFKAAIP